MNEAERVAKELTASLLQRGAFADIGPSTALQPATTRGLVPAIADQVVEIAGIVVRGVGASDYDVDGERRPTCYVYVTHGIRRAKALERKVRDVQIRVRKIGRIQVRPELAAATIATGHSFRHGTRIACGSSIGLAGEGTAGTLGAIVAKSDGTHYCLSNNHVFGGCNHTPKGQPILAPSTIDVQPGSPPVVQFALFESLVELRSGDVNYVPTQKIDAAIASISDVNLVTSKQGSFYDTPASVRDPNLGERVKKVGRTTELTHGIVESRIPSLVPLPYKSRMFSAVVNYAEVWMVRKEGGEPFALPGDSGSLVVSAKGDASVGLLFAATLDGEYGIVSAIPEVLKHFSARLVTGL